MSAKQTIAIIGASGNMGSALSRNLSKGNYRILLCSDEEEKSQALQDEIKNSNSSADVEAMACSYEASWEADMIIVAVPYAEEKEVAAKIKVVANQKIVISIANPLNETFTGLATAGDTSAAEELQQLLPHSKVVKAFINPFAADFTTPVIDGKKADALLVGNNEEALQMVSELVSTAGFNPVIAGSLFESRTQEAIQQQLVQTSRETTTTTG